MSLKSVWAADFETTTEKDFEIDGCVRVYLWHARNIVTGEEEIGFDVESFLAFAAKKPTQVWFHNLKFDGNFVLWKILHDGWEMSDVQVRGKKTFKLIVTEEGMWMQLKLQFGSHVCELRDSAKKFPGFSLEDIAKEFKIEGKSFLDTHKRRDLNYHATEEDIERVKGDTRILAVAMHSLIFDAGMTKLTMASDAKNCYLF